MPELENRDADETEDEYTDNKNEEDAQNEEPDDVKDNAKTSINKITC